MPIEISIFRKKFFAAIFLKDCMTIFTWRKKSSMRFPTLSWNELSRATRYHWNCAETSVEVSKWCWVL